MQTSKVNALVNAADDPQVLTLFTVTLPATVPQVHVMLVVPWPAVIAAPVGTVHNWVTPVTAGVVKFTPTCDGQTEAAPVMLAGVPGKRVSASVLLTLPPQLFTQATLRVPVVNVLGILMTTLFKLLDAIVQPAGAVQL
jgi:hypothetical protein